MHLPSAFAGLVALSGLAAAGCNANNCLRAVTGTRAGQMPPLSSRQADCSSFQRVTVTPAMLTVTSTATVTVTNGVVPAKRDNVGNERRAVTTSRAVPAYASPCSSAGAYSSACSCWGIGATTITAATPKTTVTVTVTVTTRTIAQSSTTTSSSSSSSSIISSSSSSSSSTSSSSTSAAPLQPTQLCQATGTKISPAIRSSTEIADNTFNACRALCLAEPLCKSFSIEIKTGGACSLYGVLVYLDFQLGNSGPTIFFDADCPAPVVAGPSVTLAVAPPPVATDSVPSGPGPVVSFADYTPPSIVKSDSPPYTPTGPRPTPTDDNEFISTYTYTQYPLPTMVDIGRPPVTTGIGLSMPSDLPCLLSAGSDHPFTLLNEDFIPMVTRTGSIGPLLQPTKAPEAGDPILNPLTFTVPGFYLQQVATDVYDMVYAETGQYVAMTALGQVILVDASTGPSFSGGHATSIFSFDCRGTIFISLGGTKYAWSTQGESCSIAPAANPANNMKTLPHSVPKVQEPADKKRALELVEKLKARVNTDTHEPQCPNTPRGLVSRTKQGYEMDQGNFCEDLNDWWGISPFDFDTACTLQSLCFDQCSGFSFVGCTAIFSYAMYLTCADNFENWWDVIKAGACAAQATVFVGLAASETGQKLYNKAQSSMCRCFCSDPPDTCVYLDASGGLSDNFYCANLHSNDMLNCGSCGGQCGPNSACKSGKCGCPQDQCGDQCLDLRNNPNNCGTCGNVCDPKYCVGGQCYKPSPDECAPDQGVTNGKFEVLNPWFANWTSSDFSDGTVLGTDVTFSASSYTYDPTKPATRAFGVSMKNIRAPGFNFKLSQKNVKMCPGFKYELKFNMGYVNQVDGAGVISNADCQVRWLTGPPSTPDSNDGFKSSPWYSIGISNPTYQTFGPWAVGSVKAGDPGVTKVKANLFIELTAVVSCRKPVGGSGQFIITDVQLNQVGMAKRSEDDSVRHLEQRNTTSVVSRPSVEFEPIGPLQHTESTFVKVSARRRGL